MSTPPPKRSILRLGFSADRRSDCPPAKQPARHDPRWSELIDRIDRLETRHSRRT